MTKTPLPTPSKTPALLASGAIPPFAALRAFEAVGRMGGIRKAAAALSLNHAVVSRHIAALESWVGQPLVNRTRGTNLLTPIGEEYHRRVHDALVQLGAATRELMREGETPQLRVWANGGFASKWLGPLLTDFAHKHPDIQIELRPSDGIPDLLADEADIDIRYYGDAYSPHRGSKGLRSLELVRPDIVAVAAPGWCQRFAPIRTVDDMVNLPLLHEESDDQWRAWLAVRGVRTENPLPGPRLWHAHIAIAAAVQGEGVALASSYLAKEELRSGQLVELVPPDSPTTSSPLGAYYFTAREDRWRSAQIARFRDWLQTRILENAAR